MFYNYQPQTAAVFIASVSITWDFHLVGHLKKSYLEKSHILQTKERRGGRKVCS